MRSCQSHLKIIRRGKTKEIGQRIFGGGGRLTHTVTIPAGLRTIQVENPGGPIWFLDELPNSIFQRFNGYLDSMAKHDATYYGIVLRDDEVEREESK